MRTLSLLVLPFALACDVPSASFDGRFGTVSRQPLPMVLDASVTCQPALPALIADVPGGRGARVAFVGEAVAVASVKDAGVEVQVITPGRAPVVRSFLGPAANLSLGTSGAVLGVAWDTASVDSSVHFAVVDTVSGVASAPSQVSPSLGRSQEPVTAREPRVAARDSGFFVAWVDGRYQEPRGSGNLFGWWGLYGRAVDLQGESRGPDVQIVQTSGGSRTFDVTSSGTEWLTVWLTHSSPPSVSGRFSGTGYTPRGEPAPFAVLSERSGSGFVRLATGADGRVLAAVPLASSTGAPRVGTLVVSRSGASAFTTWPDEVAVSALAPTSDGYVAVALPTLWQLDADGRRVRSQALTLSALGAGDLGDVSVSVAGQRVSLVFTLVTSAGVSVWSAAECLP